MKKDPIFEIIQNDLTVLETELLSILHLPGKLITDVGNHLMQAGGKRLRPALYLICARSGQNEFAQLMSVAASLELIHMATLVHDDVIDNSETRRGFPTANARWGNHASVLSGDYLFAKAFSIVAAKVNSQMLQVLTDIICTMCEGEIMQHLDIFNPDQTEQEYLARIAKKTADFLAASCELGGLSANLSPEDVQALRQYGYSIGLAFQITDDILDVTASMAQIGKPVGNDLRQGIVTLPVIYALEHSSACAELKEIVITRNMTDEQVTRGLAIVQEIGAVEYSYRRVDDYLAEARNLIPATLSSDVRDTLIAVADFVGLRKF